MEFLLYLTPAGQEIYNMISKKIKVSENTSICRSYDIYGWYNGPERTMVFCTDKIKTSSNPKYYVNETLFHESVHVAQSCKNGMGYIKPFGIASSQISLTASRKRDLNRSVKMSGYNVFGFEKEALWMEDKPDKVKYVIQKYCF